MHLRSFLLFLCLALGCVQALKNAVRGKKCAQNQVVNKLTVYEDGAIEAECGPLPCGTTAACTEDLSSCKAPSEVFSGMKWARNGQSLLLRCCSMQAVNKVYIGTDLVTLGSYYTGGVVPEQDMMGQGGTEFDFVANARTEQGGVRVWVYRVVCGQSQPKATNQKEPVQLEEPKFAEAQDAQIESQQSQQQSSAGGGGDASAVEEGFEAAPNPLQYRPRHKQAN